MNTDKHWWKAKKATQKQQLWNPAYRQAGTDERWWKAEGISNLKFEISDERQMRRQNLTQRNAEKNKGLGTTDPAERDWWTQINREKTRVRRGRYAKRAGRSLPVFRRVGRAGAKTSSFRARHWRSWGRSIASACVPRV